MIAAGMSLAALPVSLLALEAPVWTLYVSLAFMGIEWGLYDPFWTTCMQRVVAPGHDLPRVQLRLRWAPWPSTRRGWRWPGRSPTPSA